VEESVAAEKEKGGRLVKEAKGSAGGGKKWWRFRKE
jgi:hypothetical protein